MLMHVTVRGGCTNTVRESALKVDSVRKISLTAYRGMEPTSGLRLNFGPNALPTEISCPLDLDLWLLLPLIVFSDTKSRVLTVNQTFRFRLITCVLDLI